MSSCKLSRSRSRPSCVSRCSATAALHRLEKSSGSHTPPTHLAAVGVIASARVRPLTPIEQAGRRCRRRQIVRSFYEALARDEFPEEVIDPDVEYVSPDGAVEAGTRHGVSAFRRAVEKVFEGWATWETEPEQLVALGNQVAVVVRYRARARTSGVELGGRESALLTLRDGKVVRYEWFHEPGEALGAADR
jgi:ketosteroid isomerase-like protein